MSEQNTLKRDLQKELTQDKTQQEGKKKQNPFLIILAILLVLILTSLVGYFAYAFGKNKGIEERSKMTTDTTIEDEDSDDTTITSDETTEEEIDTTDSETSDPYEGWEEYENNTCNISFKYPSDWELDDSDYPSNAGIKLTYSQNDSIYLYILGCQGKGMIGGHGWCADEFVAMKEGCLYSFSAEDKDTITVNGKSEELTYCKLSGITVSFLLPINTNNATDDMYEINGHAGTKEIETIKMILESFEYTE